MEDPIKKTLFQDNTPEERAQLLTDNAIEVTTMDVKREFSREELEEMKDRHAELSIEIHDENVKKADFMEKYKAETKQRLHESGVLVKCLKHKSITEAKDVYALDNQEDGLMEFYGGDGVLVSERPLLSPERQTRIRSINNGTHGG